MKIPDPDSAAGTFKHVEKYRKTKDCFVQLFDDKVVVGREHLNWAYEKALYTTKRGTNRCDSLEMETLLWASGHRQIKNAIDKMGLHDDAEEAVVMASDNLNSFLEYMGWQRDDSILEPSIEKLLALGMTKEEIETTDKPYDLVFEFMATSVI